MHFLQGTQVTLLRSTAVVECKVLSSYSWAVHAGNVGAVPVPAAVWLFGSGLIELLGLARRKR